MRSRGSGLAPVLLLTVALAARADEPIFDLIQIPTRGRTVAAELMDVDGDARADLVHVDFLGFPPRERRVVRVHLQSARGELPAEPSFERELPPGSVAYDVADLREEPGSELVLLRRDGVALLSLASPEGEIRPLTLPGVASVGPLIDERGFERIPLVWREFGAEPWLLVPLLGELIALSPSGEVLAHLEAGGRANYFVPRQPSLFFIESDIQLFYDAPRLSVGNVNDDGRTDIVAAGRHELRVFLRREDGSFPRQPDRNLALGLVSDEDHIRGSGGVSAEARDIDGNGSLDLLVTHIAGSFTSARVDTTVYRNRNGGWDLDDPDCSFQTESHVGSDTLVDLDGDGRPELVRSRIPFSPLELIEALVTSSIDVRVSVHRFEASADCVAEPWLQLKLGIPIDFETFRTAGFVPNIHADLNADGNLDLLTSGSGDAVEVHLGGGDRPYKKTDARQDFDTHGQLRLGDLDGDGFQDLVIFQAQREGASLRIARNRGVLPGTPPALRSSP